MSTFYNSTWYVLGLIILAAVGTVFLAMKRRQFAAVLYLVVPLIFYSLIVEDPRTHLYTVFIPAAVLAGVGALEIWRKVQNRQSKLLTAASLTTAMIWLVIVTLYPILLFVDNTLERQRTWEINRPLPWLYLTTWDAPPSYGLFGYPHQAGWRAALELIEFDGDLPYISNEEEEITNWYMSQSSRTHCPDFVTYIEAANTQDSIHVPELWRRDLSLRSVVTVNGIPSLEFYSRAPVDKISIVEANDKDHWVTPEEFLPTLPANLRPLEVTLEGKVGMVGYDLDTSEAWAGGQVIVTIYWQALAPLDRNNQVFTHLYDGIIRAQQDGAPECGINPTTRWEPGQIIPDSHIIELPQDIPTGKIPLIVGMYDLVTGERLQVDLSDEDFVHLTDVTIVER
jgi:hypothetical protein